MRTQHVSSYENQDRVYNQIFIVVLENQRLCSAEHKGSYSWQERLLKSCKPCCKWRILYLTKRRVSSSSQERHYHTHACKISPESFSKYGPFPSCPQGHSGENTAKGNYSKLLYSLNR